MERAIRKVSFDGNLFQEGLSLMNSGGSQFYSGLLEFTFALGINELEILHCHRRVIGNGMELLL